MRIIGKAAVAALAVMMIGSLCNPGKSEALSVPIRKPATTCPAGTMWDVTTSTCKTISYTGSSSSTPFDLEVQWSYNTISSSWELVLIVKAPDLAGTTTLSQVLLYSFSGSSSTIPTNADLPRTFLLPTLEFTGFNMSSAPKMYYVDGPLWNRVTGTIIDTTSVPEPSTVLLLGAGLACMAGLVFRRRKANP